MDYGYMIYALRSRRGMTQHELSLRAKVGTNPRLHKSKSMQRKMKQDLELHGADAKLARKLLPGLKLK